MTCILLFRTIFIVFITFNHSQSRLYPSLVIYSFQYPHLLKKMIVFIEYENSHYTYTQYTSGNDNDNTTVQLELYHI